MNLPLSRGIENEAKAPNSQKEAVPDKPSWVKVLLVEDGNGEAGGGAGVGVTGAGTGLGVLPPPSKSPLSRSASGRSTPATRLLTCSPRLMGSSKRDFGSWRLSKRLSKSVWVAKLSRAAFELVAIGAPDAGSLVAVSLDSGGDTRSGAAIEDAGSASTDVGLDRGSNSKLP